MSSAIQNVMQRALGDAARASKFEALFQFTNPATPPSDADLMAMVKTASFPGKSHSTIDFKFKGRSIPLKGQTTYTQTWECTFYLTEDHKLKNAFENWIEALDQKHNYVDVGSDPNLAETQRIHKESYTTSINIFQKNFNDDAETAKYTLFNVFPTSVSQVETNYESVGQVQEFTVAFAYSHFTSEVMKGQSGNFVDAIVSKFQSAAQAAINDSLNAVGDSINSFVRDAVGDTFNELSDWSRNLSVDVVPQNSERIARELVSGGLGPEHMETTFVDRAQELFNSSLGGFTSTDITET